MVLEGASSKGRALAANITPGPVKEGDSYRCELAGLIGGVLLITLICKAHNITTGGVLVACDNISSIWIFDPAFIPDPTEERFAPICCLYHLIQTSSVTLAAEHVWGHQVGKKTSSQLTRLELLNDEMDNSAKAFWNYLLFTGHCMVAPQHHVFCI